jgi:hypothetical protein
MNRRREPLREGATTEPHSAATTGPPPAATAPPNPC